MKDDDLIDQRLGELDFNGDKDVEFPEFVWGLSAWVGIFEDDDDDDIESDLRDAEHNKIANASNVFIQNTDDNTIETN
eukprot:CAMPEP_0114661296 /NCGR_PEP_ID=MMETSP0191-20121206/22165_1 /TAXON_ID=126664 /ORGANISM="Sorites sp." /LENGTH=77 /DNA_ID=CAMNT_0001893295 /DNA_START=651 /DNA_END=887 /DNA_ORIENTATION=+